jgi:hypothetical protein
MTKGKFKELICSMASVTQELNKLGNIEIVAVIPIRARRENGITQAGSLTTSATFCYMESADTSGVSYEYEFPYVKVVYSK